jgi:membrane associated rhomboid family serine protease
VIPLRDENPTKSFPFITIAIIVINILVFIYELSLGTRLQDKIFYFSVVPYNITHLGSLNALLTLITSLFFHASFAHIIGNMLYFWVFGNNIEDKLGHIRFIFFYLSCGIVATLGHIITAPNSKIPLIGASGAISGILGAYLLLYPRAKILVLMPFFYFWRIVKVQALWFLLFWIILQFFYGTTSYALTNASVEGGVAWFAHIFGFFAGIILLGLMKEGVFNNWSRKIRRRDKWQR